MGIKEQIVKLEALLRRADRVGQTLIHGVAQPFTKQELRLIEAEARATRRAIGRVMQGKAA
jgi:hypothetical protein